MVQQILKEFQDKVGPAAHPMLEAWNFAEHAIFAEDEHFFLVARDEPHVSVGDLMGQ